MFGGLMMSHPARIFQSQAEIMELSRDRETHIDAYVQ